MTEDVLLTAARAGDADAFARLIAPHRARLQAHCYRMLGSAHDAEDALQDTLLRAWRGLARFEGRSSLRSWLYTIATNTCLRTVERRPRRVLPVDYGPPADPHDDPGEPLLEMVWVEPFPDETLADDDLFASPAARYEQRESVELAFVAALQYLPARQRAVLILRDVLGFTGEEVAAQLDITPAAVYSALQRAHKTVDERLPKRSQQTTLRSIGDASARAIVAEFVDAWEHGDVDAVVATLAADVTMTMPPLATWFRGRDAVAAFLREWPMAAPLRWRVVPVRANGQLATAHYLWDKAAVTFRAHSISVLTLRESEIAEFNAFLSPEPFAAFGLPVSIESIELC
ncbi:ECF RNA polymerase sigma factor SigG [Frankia sp. Hr75.2]|nr:ECF RNA polymerase sigma factor SigG [Frankia sp. Hr75.2]